MAVCRCHHSGFPGVLCKESGKREKALYPPEIGSGDAAGQNSAPPA